MVANSCMWQCSRMHFVVRCATTRSRDNRQRRTRELDSTKRGRHTLVDRQIAAFSNIAHRGDKDDENGNENGNPSRRRLHESDIPLDILAAFGQSFDRSTGEPKR